ncbi:MAG: MFS transporter [Pseudomonadota bacterium]
MVSSKFQSFGLLLVAEVAAMALWFVSAAVLPEMLREVDLADFQQAALTSAVQAGFVTGALISAFTGISDRYDPRRVFAISALLAALFSYALLVVGPDSVIAIVFRFLTGAMLAGVYPVGMKIASGWGLKDRGLLIGAVVGALTLGSAAPHLIALNGGADWRLTVAIVSIAAGLGGLLVLFISLGPHHATASKFDARVLATAWTNRRVRLAYAGYLGHMWELYVMWAWIGVAAATSYAASMPEQEANDFAKLTAFFAIAGGGLACIVAGYAADRIGKANITIIAMVVSGVSALLTALTFGGPPWLTFVVVLVWGISVIPDSAQFSALVADASPPDQAGSLLTLQTSLGFTLTFFTVQLTPTVVGWVGWPTLIAILALGPAFGVLAMLRHRQIDRDTAE